MVEWRWLLLLCKKNHQLLHCPSATSLSFLKEVKEIIRSNMIYSLYICICICDTTSWADIIGFIIAGCQSIETTEASHAIKWHHSHLISDISPCVASLHSAKKFLSYFHILNYSNSAKCGDDMVIADSVYALQLMVSSWLIWPCSQDMCHSIQSKVLHRLNPSFVLWM